MKKIKKLSLTRPVVSHILTLKDLKAFYRRTDWELPPDKICREYLKFYIRTHKLTLAERCTLYADPALRFHYHIAMKSERLEGRVDMLKTDEIGGDIYSLLEESLEEIRGDLMAIAIKLAEFSIAVKIESRGFSTNWFMMSLDLTIEKSKELIAETYQDINAALVAVKSKNPNSALITTIEQLSINVARKIRRIPVMNIAKGMLDLAEVKKISEQEPSRIAWNILNHAGFMMQESVLHQVTSTGGKEYKSTTSHLNSTVEMSQWNFWWEFRILEAELKGKILKATPTE